MQIEIPLPKPLKSMSRKDMWDYGWKMKNAGVPYKERITILKDWERITGEKWK